MDTAVLLAALKVDLGITGDRFNERLTDRLNEAQAALTAQGITLADTVADRDLVVMYAAWLWRDRVTGAPMPRMVAQARNNRLFGEKMREAST